MHRVALAIIRCCDPTVCIVRDELAKNCQPCAAANSVTKRKCSGSTEEQTSTPIRLFNELFINHQPQFMG